MFQPKTVKIGVIGLASGKWHIESFLSIPEAKVSAICDIDENKIKSITTRYGIIRSYTNYEDLCKSDDIDAVSICTPNYLHTPIAICAIENRKHLLCETPLSTTSEEAEKILKTLNKYPDIKAMTAVRFRFNRDAIYIKNAISNGDIGNVYYGFASYFKQLARSLRKNNWRVKKELSGGGALLDNGFNLIDLIWWIMGCPKPVEVFGSIYSENPDDSVEDLATAMIRFETGTTITIESGWKSFIHDGYMALRVFGTKGNATLWPFRILIDEGPHITARTADHSHIIPENPFTHFINCIMSNKNPISNIFQGVIVLKMLDAIYQSAKERKVISIKL
ncbi:MAG: Gfo/Idh/MocA family protein [Candidatus Poribacteria bacterium]